MRLKQKYVISNKFSNRLLLKAEGSRWLSISPNGRHVFPHPSLIYRYGCHSCSMRPLHPLTLQTVKDYADFFSFLVLKHRSHLIMYKNVVFMHFVNRNVSLR